MSVNKRFLLTFDVQETLKITGFLLSDTVRQLSFSRIEHISEASGSNTPDPLSSAPFTSL